jgi:hypothetical protein
MVPGVLSQSKFENITFIPVGDRPVGVQTASVQLQGGAQSVAFGSLGTQTFYNSLSGVQLGEAESCLQPLNSSRWYGLDLQTSGDLVVDTIGAEVRTVLTVHQLRAGADPQNLRFGDIIGQKCDISTGPESASLVHWTVPAGKYAIQIDRLQVPGGAASLGSGHNDAELGVAGELDLGSPWSVCQSSERFAMAAALDRRSQPGGNSREFIQSARQVAAQPGRELLPHWVRPIMILQPPFPGSANFLTVQRP